MRKISGIPACLGALLLSLSPLLAGKALAGGPIISSGGFESPDFNTGNLIGQQGWSSVGDGSSTAVVQDAMSNAGSQALQVSRAADSDRRWADPVADFPTGRYVTISWDMAVTVTQTPGIFGPFFGVEAYDEQIDDVRLLGSLGVDGTTGEVLLQEQDTGFIAAPGPIVASNVWNHFEIELDFLNDTYSTYLNGSLVDSTGFVDRNFGLDDFTDADIGTFAIAGDVGSVNATGTAWVDNFIVIDGIPGDYDGDDHVGAADYVLWRNSEGNTGVAAAADGNGDGVVNDTDYNIWVNNFGRGNLMSGSGSGSAVVPEPTSAALLMLMLLAAGARYRFV